MNGLLVMAISSKAMAVRFVLELAERFQGIIIPWHDLSALLGLGLWFPTCILRPAGSVQKVTNGKHPTTRFAMEEVAAFVPALFPILLSLIVPSRNPGDSFGLGRSPRTARVLPSGNANLDIAGMLATIICNKIMAAQNVTILSTVVRFPDLSELSVKCLVASSTTS
jgi:hypothetical protein